MIYYAQGLLILFTILLASKDGDIYHLVRIVNYAKDKEYIKSWHLKGALIYSILLVIGYYYGGWKIAIAGLLIRLSFYDVVFNLFAGLDIQHTGTEAMTDKIFSKLLGKNSALIKSLISFLILIALNFLNESL